MRIISFIYFCKRGLVFIEAASINAFGASCLLMTKQGMCQTLLKLSKCYSIEFLPVYLEQSSATHCQKNVETGFLNIPD
jgi:hypothetical protein